MAPSGVLFQIEKLILEVADSIVKVRAVGRSLIKHKYAYMCRLTTYSPTYLPYHDMCRSY